MKEGRSELGGDGGDPATLGSRFRWLLPSLLVLAAAAGVLLIDDEIVQVAFLLGICALALLSGLLPGERREREREEEAGSGLDWTLFVPLVLALILARLAFDSDDDARLAALFVMAVIFSAAWRQLRIGERLRGHADGGRT